MRVEELEARRLLSTGSYLFDFGATSSPVAPGAIAVNKTPYNLGLGFGWLNPSGLVTRAPGRPGGAVTNFEYGKSGTFLVDVPQGSYEVTAVLAVPGPGGIKADGQRVTPESVEPLGKFSRVTFHVDVAGGPLDLQFSGGAGKNAIFAIASLEIQPVIAAVSVRPAAPAAPVVHVSPLVPASPAALTAPTVVTVSSHASVPSQTSPNVATVSVPHSPAGVMAPAVASPGMTPGGGTISAMGMPMGEPPGTMAGVYLPPDLTNATVVSVASGPWSSPSTWSTGRVPAAGDIVSIAPKTTVTYDAFSNAALVGVVIQSGGTLTFRTDINTRITAGTLAVLAGGTLQVGTATNPVSPNVTTDIVIADQPIDLATDPDSVGTGVLGWGTVHMYGAKKDSFLTLATEPQAGDTTLTFAQAPSGWQPGDRLVIPDSRQVYAGNNVPFNQMEWETATVKGVSGTTVTLTQPLLYSHPGARDASGALRYLPDVADLTRNVVIRSANPAGTRGHVLMTGMADVDIEYVWMKDLGRSLNSVPVDATQYDAHGNPVTYATNEIGRYPLHMHHLAGPATPQPDGYQFTLVGNSVDGGDAPNDHKWGIDVHASSYGLIQNNVVYNTSGAGVSTEDGSEVNNVFDHNYVVRTDGLGAVSYARISAPIPVLDFGHAGDGFWLQGPSNTLTNNVAADSRHSGYEYYSSEFGMQTFHIPLNQGSDPMMAGQYKAVPNGQMAFGAFSNNQAFTSAVSGLYTRFTLGVGTPVVFNGLTTWNSLSGYANEYAPTPVALNNVVVIGTPAGAADASNPTSGLDLDANPGAVAVGMTVAGADIENVTVGVAAPTNTVYAPGVEFDKAIITGQPFVWEGLTVTLQQMQSAGPFTVGNATFRGNLTDVRVDNSQPSVDQNDLLGNRTVTISNSSFSHTPAPGYEAISVDLSAVIATFGNRAWDYRALQQVLVYGFDNNPSDNFQVFAPEQSAGTVMPQSHYVVIGSPEAGLTNQQNWAKYGVATGGEVTPASATARPGILGSVAPMVLAPKAPATPPVISNLAASSPDASGNVTVTWQTNVPTDTQLYFGTYFGGVAGPVRSGVPQAYAYTTSHQVVLSGLDPNTGYRLTVLSRDPVGNYSTASAVFGRTQPPAISNVGVTTPSLTTATVTWSTDEPTTGTVEYGLTTAYGTTVGATAQGTNLTAALANLQPFTVYHYHVISRDPLGNQSVSGDYTFQTGATHFTVGTPDPGYSETGPAGWWASAKLWYGNTVSQMFYNWGGGTGTATWSFGSLPAGTYQVFTSWYSSSDASTDVPYAVSDGQGPAATAVVNQRSPEANGFWYQGEYLGSIGQFSLRGGNVSVTATDTESGTRMTAGTMILVRVGP
jgi:hypothetical protein